MRSPLLAERGSSPRSPASEAAPSRPTRASGAGAAALGRALIRVAPSAHADAFRAVAAVGADATSVASGLTSLGTCAIGPGPAIDGADEHPYRARRRLRGSCMTLGPGRRRSAVPAALGGVVLRLEKSSSDRRGGRGSGFIDFRFGFGDRIGAAAPAHRAAQVRRPTPVPPLGRLASWPRLVHRPRRSI